MVIARRAIRVFASFFSIIPLFLVIVESIMFPDRPPFITLLVVTVFLASMTLGFLGPLFTKRLSLLFDILIAIGIAFSFLIGIISIMSIGLYFLAPAFFAGILFITELILRKISKNKDIASSYKLVDLAIVVLEVLLISAIFWKLRSGPLFLKISIISSFILFFALAFLFFNPLVKRPVSRIAYFLILPVIVVLFLNLTGISKYGIGTSDPGSSVGPLGDSFEYEDYLFIEASSELPNNNEAMVVKLSKNGNSMSTSHSEEGQLILLSGIKHKIKEDATKVYYGIVKLKRASFVKLSFETGESYLAKVGSGRQFFIQQTTPDIPQKILIYLLDKDKNTLKRIETNPDDEEF